MARVKPRSNIYALMPILATLIMAAGIYFTWERVRLYTLDLQPKPRPEIEGLRYIEPDPSTTPTAGPATDVETKAPEDTKAAPTEGPGDVAPKAGPGEDPEL